ncbi:glycosyltransferase like family 2-domain-containing protein [Lineolata rhizophorae]|uniref:Glycosyltransferase like family 2-domain-containing protein n=1 Tax=Lineolata rhizophorae TaxID=578093 RepID=A0A6A6NS64_9PEZI|nr:glycosyltransferase like family 2-domain-containing protein [Lineolata rhizophorae]
MYLPMQRARRAPGGAGPVDALQVRPEPSLNCFAFLWFSPVPIPAEPSYTSQDVTIIIPTIDGDGEELRETIRSCLKCEPHEIILVTIDANLKRACEMVAAMPSTKVRVLSVSQANKRRQMCRAFPEVSTKITLLADDDVIWPKDLIKWILAPFENPKMGGVGTCQRLRRSDSPNHWEFLAAAYLERRNFDIAACTYMDGGLPCLSGRTVAYRTHVLQDPNFTYGFTHETWGEFLLNADDDNFITRWMLSHGWETYVQYHKACEVQTTLENNPRFIRQCLRWSRSNWRSNFKTLWVERYVWRLQPWSTYAVFLTTFTQLALLWDALITYFLWAALSHHSTKTQWTCFSLYGAVWFTARWIKLCGHWIRYPGDLIYLPLSILFGYAHGAIKIWAFLTLNASQREAAKPPAKPRTAADADMYSTFRQTTWGTREGADTDDAYPRMILLPAYRS